MQNRSLNAFQEPEFQAWLGKDEEEILQALSSLRAHKGPERLWSRDPSLWKAEAGSQEKIKNRLGWLTVAGMMKNSLSDLADFSRTIKEGPFRDVVLLGMGGSSLCPEVCRNTFGIAAGFPRFWILDSTDPGTILHLEKKIEAGKTLFILASKSGSTIEVQSLYAYFSKKMERVSSLPFGGHFMAITDPGSPLEKLARERFFRKIFLNPPDIGGRYSALSYFGLVPAAIIGMNLPLFLERAEKMIGACGPSIPLEENPGMKLGAILSVMGNRRRNKVTFLLPSSVGSFGLWAEQLIAESLGKEEKGLVPVEGEPAGDAGSYREDRLFIEFSLASQPEPALEQEGEALRKAGHPLVTLRLRDPYDLAGEFFRWEMAVAVAGIFFNVNPFDEPNVAESKENTRNLLRVYQTAGALPDPGILLKENGVSVYRVENQREEKSLSELLRAFLAQMGPSCYLALMAYLEPSPDHERLLHKIRLLIRDLCRVATTLGYGPRFLHSTGQLHKGGVREGVFIQITAEDQEALPIPDAGYSFGILKKAQSLGDLQALVKRGLQVLPIHLDQPPETGLQYLLEVLEGIIKKGA